MASKGDFMWVGFVLVCIGILVLLSNMDIIRGDVWNYIWPLILVIFGISLILKRRRKDWHNSDRPDYHQDRPAPPTA
jgi:hypothetical protein